MIAVTAILAGALLGQSTPPRDPRAAAVPAAAVLSGLVVDDRGSPIAGAFVVATGGPALPGARTATTSDSGRYAIGDLAPGFYAVSVVRNGYPPINYGQSGPNGAGRPFEIKLGQRLEISIVMPRGAVIAGTLVDDAGEPAAGGISIAPESAPASKPRRGLGAMSVGARGAFRVYGLAAGTYRVSARSLNLERVDGPPAGGMMVTVAAGEELSGIVVRVEPPRPRTYVTVAVTSPTGEAPQSLQLILRRPGDVRTTYSSNRPNPDGTRTLTDVASGRYLIVARSGASWGGTEVVVDGEHPATAAITLSRGVAVRGRVSFEPGAPAPRFTSLTLSPADSQSLMDDGNTALGRVAPDGTFSIDGVPPGRYVVRTTLDQSVPWRLASATWRDTDIADVPITIAYESVDGVAVTLTREQSVLRGRVIDAAGGPANGIDVVLFPADPALRVRNSRRVGTAHTSVSGEYEIRGLPPGAYAVALVDDLDEFALRDPAIFAQLTPVSTVTVKEGETRHDVVVK